MLTARGFRMGSGGIGFVANPILIVVALIAVGLILWVFVRR